MIGDHFDPEEERGRRLAWKTFRKQLADSHGRLWPAEDLNLDDPEPQSATSVTQELDMMAMGRNPGTGGTNKGSDVPHLSKRTPWTTTYIVTVIVLSIAAYVIGLAYA